MDDRVPQSAKRKSDASRYPIEILQSWGAASARHTSGCVVHPTRRTEQPGSTNKEPPSEFIFDAPLGPSVVRWDIVAQTRRLQFQAHCDLVTCMRLSPDGSYIATSSYSGEVKLWSPPQWECLAVAMAPMASQHHLAWSPDSVRFLIVGNGINSSIVMYSVSMETGKPQLSQLWQVVATDDESQGSEAIVQSSLTESETPPPKSSRSGLDYQHRNAFYMAEIYPSGNVLAVQERQSAPTLAQLYSPEGKLLKTAELTVDGGSKKLDTLLISTYREGSYALGVQGGCVLYLDAESLAVTRVLNVGFSSRTCVWDGSSLVLPADSGKLVWWEAGGEKLGEFRAGSADYIVRLDWSVSGHALWLCGFSVLSYLQVKRKDDGSVLSVTPSHMIKSHDIACCGVAFSPCGQYLASGDLAGGVWITQQDDIMPKYKCSISVSVRCLVWRDGCTVLIGCLDGTVHRWQLGSLPVICMAVKGSVIHMAWDHRRKHLAVGTSMGVLAVHELPEGGETFETVATVTAHPPKEGKQDQRFGQLGRQAEVWSLCWSPDDGRIATCSEDQTAKIWDTKTWKCLATLTGHTMAVTSVDWKEMKGGRSLMATCSDDRTVRLIDGSSYELLRVVDTKDIHGWHTLTYLAFDPSEDSSVLVCTTQNGHLVIWDSLTGERLAKGKIHCGSIEGLAWDHTHHCLATVGADCAVHMIRLNCS